MDSINPDSHEVKLLFPREVRREAQVQTELGHAVNWLSVPLDPIHHHLVRFVHTGRAALFTTGAQLGPVIWGHLLPRTMQVLATAQGPNGPDYRRLRVDRRSWPIDLPSMARDFEEHAYERLLTWEEGPQRSMLELDLFEAWALRRVPGATGPDTLELAWLRQAARQKLVPPPDDLESLIDRLITGGEQGNDTPDQAQALDLGTERRALLN
jgi:hypothetical protein